MRTQVPFAFALTLIIAACSGASGPPGGTAVPVTAVSTASQQPTAGPTAATATSAPAASMTAKPTVATTAPSSPAARPTARPLPTATPVVTPPVTDVTVVAKDFAFSTPAVTTRAGKQFTIAFVNQDYGTNHNIHIVKADGTDPFPYAFDGFGFDVVTGGLFVVYQVPALKPGTYPFSCDVHPEMTGTLTVT